MQPRVGREAAALIRHLLLCLVALAPAAVPAANRLAQADSPYLRMHGNNPVDWYPWGEEAFARAGAEGKPVFLSIGYSSCYWCRVAEETLYRDPAIAARMNAGFVNVKVDREQRPDLDRIYMSATRLLGGSGGWPNNLFLTPERKPFFAGSYFPPRDDDLGRPGFPSVMARVADAWAKQRAAVERRGEAVAAALRGRPAAAGDATPALWRQEAHQVLQGRVDPVHGGLASGAAKFPLVAELGLLGGKTLTRALDAMAASALRDHLGGGFHRYTIDARWNQPHFEKMLYDNAQLLRLFAGAGTSPLHRAAARETAAFLLRELQDPAGGFHAALDAVSDGREGAYYLWTEDEIRAALGPGAAPFLAAYRLAPQPGGLESAEDLDGPRAALRLPAPAAAGQQGGERTLAQLAPQRAELLRLREQRPRPARDEKIILAWNGLAIEALAIAAEKLADPALAAAARRAADRLWRDAWQDGRLRHAIFEGRAQGEGFLEDYALFGRGLLALGQRQRASQLAAAMLRDFARADGGLASTRHAADLFAPAEENGDGPYPAGASAAWDLLTRLADGGESRWRAPAARLLATLAPRIAGAPEKWPALLAVLPATAVAASAAAGSAGVVDASVRQQGGRLVVGLRIAAGWHVNAHPASLDYLVPTRIEFDGAAPVDIVYPAAGRLRTAFAGAEIDVYEGAIEIAANFAAAKPPRRAWLHVQACSDEVCLPPARIPLSLPSRTR